MPTRRSNILNSHSRLLRLKWQRGLISLLPIILMIGLGEMIHAQVDDLVSAPPPLKQLSKSERDSLNSKPAIKDRNNIALSLMESRLRSAEKFGADENFFLMYAELGGFHALMDNNLDFLLRSQEPAKRLSGLKRFEIGLRSFVSRVEALRRSAPSAFEPYIISLLKNISQAREKALEPMFDDAGQRAQ